METRIADLGGPVHYADWGGDGPTMVLVHGLGGSHLNWMAVAPTLATRYRVLAPDLPGFGLSPPQGRATGVEANRDVLDRFIAEVAGGTAIVAGNSMGGLISLLLTADHPERVSSLILVDAALPRPASARPEPRVLLVMGLYSVPWAGEWYLRNRAQRLGPEGLVRETLRLCCVDPSRVPPEVVAAHVELARRRQQLDWAPAAFIDAARSITRLLLRPARVVAAIERIRVPTLLVHGDQDRLVSLAAATATLRRRPDWGLEVFDGVGHTPQLEVPERFTRTVLDRLDAADAGKPTRPPARRGRAVAATR
jgi:pimeloyl-ACP methyl ester carboxylesterase